MRYRENHCHYNWLTEQLKEFDSVSLAYVDEKLLALSQNRFETKFLMSAQSLSRIIPQLQTNYSILKVNQSTIQDYANTYYDNKQLDCYHDHHTERFPRFKIRTRQYNNTGPLYFEIKHKEKPLYTEKFRIKLCTDAKKTQLFISNHLPTPLHQHSAVLNTHFKRIALIHKQSLQRITLDFELLFSTPDNHKSIKNPLVIAEIKQATGIGLTSTQLLFRRQHDIFPSAFSKYSMACCQLFPDLKQNRFKPILRLAKKIDNGQHSSRNQPVLL